MQAGTTIFEHMSGLACAHGAINLGQGFPDFGWPQSVLQAAADAALTGHNQYPPMRGTPELRAAVAAFYGRRQGLALAPEQVVVTSGGTEALAASIFAIVQPGDEVIILGPAYDAYAPLVARAGGVAVLVPLAPPDWQLAPGALAAAITPRTRAIMVNTPHNPCASLAGPAMRAELAAVAAAHDLIVISDEVWEEVIAPGTSHASLLAEPGLAGRVIKIGSAGKLLALTGWKVGWVVADSALAERVAQSHQFLTFTTATPLQAAVAHGLGLPDAWFEAARARLAQARDRLVTRLQGDGWVVLPSAGSYFVLVDLPASGVEMADMDFCEAAVRQAGVAAIPLSAFTGGREAGGTRFIRLCFAKQDAVLDAGADALARARQLA